MPTPFDSVASLLEELIHIAKQQLSEAKEANRIGRRTLDVEKKNLQASEHTLRIAKESLTTEQAILESSHRIEILLGGTGPAKPTTMEVKYQFTLEGAKTE